MSDSSVSLMKNTFYNIAKSFSSIIFPLITFPYISRVLMPENVGKYNFSNTYISYFTLAASLGVTTYAVRECAKVKDSRETVSRVASEIFSINVCTMMISYAALFVSLILVSRLKEYRSLILILSSTIFFTIVGADWINTAFEDIRYITLRTFMFQAISLGLMFTIVRGKDDYVKYAMITAFSLCGANVLNVFYRRRFCDIKFVLHMNWRKHFPGIIMLFVMLFAQQIYCNSDITMLGIMRSNYEVGLYSLSVRIYTALTQVISSILWVLLPRLTERYVTKDYELDVGTRDGAFLYIDGQILKGGKNETHAQLLQKYMEEEGKKDEIPEDLVQNNQENSRPSEIRMKRLTETEDVAFGSLLKNIAFIEVFENGADENTVAQACMKELGVKKVYFLDDKNVLKRLAKWNCY